MKTMWDEDWFCGFFWWDWYTFLPTKEKELGFSIYGKKTEDIVRKMYTNN